MLNRKLVYLKDVDFIDSTKEIQREKEISANLFSFAFVLCSFSLFFFTFILLQIRKNSKV